MKRRLNWCGLLALVALLATAGVSRSWAQEPPPQNGAQERGRGMGGMFGMNANGAHGTVTAVTGNEITVQNEQGETYKVVTGPNTHFRKDRQEAKLSDVHTGDVIVAMGDLEGKTLGAAFVVVLDPQQAAEMKKRIAEFGKTWTAGRVTAINDLTLTVERPDKVKQTIAVNENTSFQKRGRGTEEDITFPDIKVGDMVNARGALQGSDFVATTLTVMEPGRRGQGRFGPGSQNRPAPPSDGAPAGTPPGQPPAPQQN